MSVIHVLDGHPRIEVELRPHARARRLTLRVSAHDGRVTLTHPPRYPSAQAASFAQSKHAWLARQLSQHVPPTPLKIGETLPIEGRDRRVALAQVRRIELTESEVLLPQRYADRLGPALKAQLKELARERLSAASDHYAGRLGCTYSRITLRDTRSRWGSCSSQGALMYSWRLIMAPPEVLSYVAAHEVAHLREMNHSSRFWAVVSELIPDYAAHRAWLKAHGAALQRIILD